MPIHEFLRDAVVVLAASTAVVLASHRLRVPAVVGFLLTGVLIGPSALGLVRDPAQVEVFAEIGVVFLLFAIGLEFSLERLNQIRRAFFLGGSLQSLLTIALGGAAALGLGLGLPQAAFFGFLLALSSTAIVLKLYADRRELDAPQGKLVIGILLFQDFLIVPMIVLTPVLAGAVEASALAILLRFLGALALVGAVFFAARHLMPRLLHLLVRTRLREVVVLGSLLVCLGMAWLTESLEFSLALGAFLAGIVISESEYSHQVVAEVTPFRDVFNSLFFISVGMLLDLSFALAHPLRIAGLALLVLVVKVAAAGAAVALLGYPARIVALVALGLAQVGEFSFVLLRVGQRHALLGPGFYQAFLAASVISMMLTPVLIALAPRWAAWLAGRRGARLEPPAAAAAGRAPNVVIVGFGVNGKNLARVLRQADLPYRVVELSPEAVRQAREAGEPVVFGDSTRPEILEHAGICSAQVAVFAISDLEAVRRGIRLARGLNPRLHIIVRTRMVAEIEGLRRCGADEVLAEEFETSIEIFTRVLRRFHVPRHVIFAETRALRGEDYRMFRAPGPATGLSDALLEALAAGTTDLYRLAPTSPLAGQTLRDTKLRSRTGASAIAVVRGEEARTNPGPDFRLEPGDCLVLVGSHAEIEGAVQYLQEQEGGSAEPV